MVAFCVCSLAGVVAPIELFLCVLSQGSPVLLREIGFLFLYLQRLSFLRITQHVTGLVLVPVSSFVGVSFVIFFMCLATLLSVLY